MLANSSETMAREQKKRLLLHEVRNSIGVMMLNLHMVEKDSTTTTKKRIDTIREELDALTTMLEVIAKQ